MHLRYAVIVPPDPSSLRERKKEKTRLAIQQVALDLFERQGYERTTIEQIAAVAEVSPSTVYRYFATKEAIVFWDRWDPRVLDAIAARPAGEPAIDSLRAALDELMPVAMAEEGGLIHRRMLLSLGEPELRAHVNEIAEEVTALFVQTLARRDERPEDDFELQVAGHAAMSALVVAMHTWAATGGDLVELCTRALTLLSNGTRPDVEPAVRRRPTSRDRQGRQPA